MWRISSQLHVALAALYFLPGPPTSSKDGTWISFCHLLSQSTHLSGENKNPFTGTVSSQSKKKYLFLRAVRFQYIIITNIKSPCRCETQVKEVSL